MRILHSSIFDNRNVTKNNDPQYLRLEILHSVHYTRKTQNIEHEYSTIHFSSLRLVFTRWESDVLHNAQQCATTLWRVSPVESIPFGGGVGRASTESFTPAFRQIANSLCETRGKYSSTDEIS